MIKKIINILKENDNNDNDEKNHAMYMLSLDIYEKYFIVLFATA